MSDERAQRRRTQAPRRRSQTDYQPSRNTPSANPRSRTPQRRPSPDDPRRREGSRGRAASPRPHSPEGQRAHRAQHERRQAARPNHRQMPQQRDGRRQPQRYRQPPRRHRSSAVPALIAVVAVIVLFVGGFFAFRHFTTKRITVNGEQMTVARAATPRTLVEEGVVDPKPGNLLAVDGSLISKGDGHLCTATANGNSIGEDAEIPPDATVQIGDGTDATEDYDESEEVIPHDTASGDTSFSGYWTGAIHLLSEGEDGVKTIKTGRKSNITVEEVTKPAVDAGYIIYSAKPADKVIALTFDDGPWKESTEAILDILEENGAKATFFTIGNQIEGFEDVMQRAADMGCEICTHTWDHAAGSGGGTDIGNMSASEQVQEIEKGYAAIEDALGTEAPRIIRAPGGNFNGDTIENVWDIVDVEVGWDVDTEDWSRPGVDAISKAILSAGSGNVILMHDGGGDRSQTVEALRQTLPQLVQQGYRFVTVSELLAYGMPTASATSSSASSSDSASTLSDDTSSTSSDSSSMGSATSDSSTSEGTYSSTEDAYSTETSTSSTADASSASAV